MHPLIPNLLWFLSSLDDAWAYHQATKDAETSQERLLLKMLRDNSQTRFGQAHDFASINNIAEYQRQVPLSDYDTYSELMSAAADGQPQILTSETIHLFEPTSGSTSATKLIPYTATLKRQFNQAIAPWIVNLFAHHPTLMAGHAYWSVSPLAERNKMTVGGIPIGFDDDTDYLSSGGSLISSIMAVPACVKLISDMDSFRYVTLLFLLRCASLRLISVWNPTFLTILLDGLSQWGEQLVEDIRTGTIHTPSTLPNDVTAEIRRLNPPDPERAIALQAALALPTQAERYRAIWSQLEVISCWADAAAASHAQRLQRDFPHVLLQPKGLIATEALVSFPLVGKQGSTLAIASHFFEFIANSGEVYLAHQLQKGMTYRVVVTTGGGLYRYQLHDEIEAIGGLQIRFVGRSANIADCFGEKVSEGHVRRIWQALFETPPEFAVLSPELYPDGTTAYTLFSSVPASPELLEKLLCDNFHYDYCRKLKQLAMAQVRLVDMNAAERYLRACIARGQRAGDVKVSILYRHGGLLPYMA